MDRDLDTLAQAAWQAKVDRARENGACFGLVFGVVFMAGFFYLCQWLAEEPPLSGIDDPRFNVVLEGEGNRPTPILLREVHRELLELRRERAEANIERGDDSDPRHP